MTINAQKAALRQELLHTRQLLSGQQVEALSDIINAKCIKLVDWNGVKSLHSYVQINRKNEISTWPLLEYVWNHQPKVTTYVPVMRNGQMKHARIDKDTQWKPEVAIPQPLKLDLITDLQVDIIIVPLLGFDRLGYRLGYGGGHYDKFLALQQKALKIGFAYSSAEIAVGLPVESHDERLNYIITENEVIYIKPGAKPGTET